MSSVSLLYRMKKITILIIIILLNMVSKGFVAEYEDGFMLCDHNSIQADQKENGFPVEVFNLACRGLQKLENSHKFKFSEILTIIDYSQSSKQKRFYVIDLKSKKLLFNTYVAHGRNTGEEYAMKFSNSIGSFQSSLGFYITGNPIVGQRTGYSLKITGLETGINDNAEKREIIIHAAEYATEGFILKNGRLGRSWGCPVLPPEYNRKIIEKIKGGSCLFIYNPSPEYISASSLLN